MSATPNSDLPLPLRDVMSRLPSHEIPVLGGGAVGLIDCMPRLTPDGQDIDARAVEAARVSYGDGTRKVSGQEALIRYMSRERHTSPFESVKFTFRVKAPLFVARQWMRHRTGTFNELSARYSEMPEDYWTTQQWRGQSKANKQGSSGQVDYTPQVYGEHGETAEQIAFREYRARLEARVSRELARTCLPMSTFTKFYWTVDLHNLLHFLGLRLSSHAQPEIREYANVIASIAGTLAPRTLQAFWDYHPAMGAILLTALDVSAIRLGVMEARMSARERDDLRVKCERLGLAVPADPK